VITATNGRHDDGEKKFGATSIRLDGTGDYLTVADSTDWDFGNGIFTIDFWFKNESTATGRGVISMEGTTSTYEAILVYTSSTTLVLYSSSGGSSWDIASSAAMGAFGSDWTHYAIVRESAGGNIKLYNNGALQTTVSTSATIRTVSNFHIGKRYSQASNGASCWMDQIRISKDIARWTENFKPPHRPYATRDLVLCLDAMNAKSFTGEPTSNLICAYAVGGGALSDDVADGVLGPPYGPSFYASSAATERVNLYYNKKRPHVWSLRSTNNTGYIGFFYQATSNTSGQVYTFSYDYKVIHGTDPTTNGATVYGNGYKNPGSSNYGSNTATTTTDLRDGWKRRVFRYTCGYTGANFIRQNFYPPGSGYWHLLFDNFTFEHKAVASPYTKPSQSRVAANGWRDLSGKGNHGTFSATDFGDTGDVVLERRGEIMLGSGSDPASINFDGSNDYLDLGQATDGTGGLSLKGYGSLSICQWFNPDSLSSYGRTFYENQTDANHNYRVALGGDSSNFSFYLYTSSGGAGASKGSAIATGAWTHIAGTYDGANIRLYINGEQAGSASQTGTVESSTGSYGGIAIGTRKSGSTLDQHVNGKVATTSVWSSGLTHAQIKDIYNSQRSRFGL